MFVWLGHFTYRFRKAIVVGYLVSVLPLVWLGLPVFEKLKAGGFEVPGSEAHRVYVDLQREIKVGGADILALYTAEKGSTIDDIEPFSAAIEAITRIEADPDVVTTASFYTTGAPQLVTKDKRRTFILIALAGDDNRKAKAFTRIKSMLEAPPMTLQLGGVVPANMAVERIITEDLQRAELYAFPITAILLLLIFGSVASASLPLLLGGFAIVMALAFLRILTHVTDVSIFAVNIVSLLGLGLAIDYSLFLINRYREELVHHDPETAVVRAVSTTGRAVAFSGVTVAASLVGLFFFPQMFLRSMALGGIAVVLGAIAISCTLLPAMLAILGHRIDALRVPFAPKASKEGEENFWHKVAFAAMKRPILVVILVATPLLLVGAPFLRFDPSFPDYRILPPADPAYIANEILDKEFDGKQITPMDVLVRVDKGTALDVENLERLYNLSAKLGTYDSVKQVSGLFTLVEGIDKATLISKLSLPADKQDPQIQMGINAFANGRYMRFALLSDDSFNHPRSLQLVRDLRALEIEGLDIGIGGAAPFLVDMKDTLMERAPWMVGLVALVMFIVLFLVFGSVTLPFKAMIMNALSISASFGAIVWIFQDGRFSDVLDYVPLGISDCTAPLLMFSIVFGLSMDYEVLLLSRVREEYDRCGDNDLAVARGLAKTGRLITSAAALLVVVIGAFGTSHILFMKSLGVGMALAIALDATVIRALLVPAAMKLMGDWNWWAPGPLKRLWEKAGMGNLEGHADEPATPAPPAGPSSPPKA